MIQSSNLLLKTLLWLRSLAHPLSDTNTKQELEVCICKRPQAMSTRSPNQAYTHRNSWMSKKSDANTTLPLPPCCHGTQINAKWVMGGWVCSTELSADGQRKNKEADICKKIQLWSWKQYSIEYNAHSEWQNWQKMANPEPWHIQSQVQGTLPELTY